MDAPDEAPRRIPGGRGKGRERGRGNDGMGKRVELIGEQTRVPTYIHTYLHTYIYTTQMQVRFTNIIATLHASIIFIQIG